MSRKVRLATININNSHDYSHFASFLQHYDLDIFCLNECGSRFPHLLNEALGREYRYIYSRADYCGNALFSRYPIRYSKEIELKTSSHGLEMRSAVYGLISIPLDESNSVDVAIVGTHLSHVHESDRLEQLHSLFGTFIRIRSSNLGFLASNHPW